MIKQKNLWKTLLATAVISTNLINAECDLYGACDPCEMDSCFGGFNIGADFLYLKSCKDELIYAISTQNQLEIRDEDDVIITPASFKNTAHTISQDWKPGFRIHASVDDVLCNWNLCGSYTWYSTSHTSYTTLPATGPGLSVDLQNTIGFATLDDLSAVRANYDLNYQTFDILFAGNFALKQAQYLKPYFGMVGLYLHQEVRSEFASVVEEGEEPVVTNVKWNDHFDGYGLKMGSEYVLTLSDGFTLFANGAGVITVGSHTGAVSQPIFVVGGPEVPGSFGYDETIFIPGWSIETGIRSFGCFCDIDYELQLAYQFADYCNVPNVPMFSAVNDGTYNSTTISNLGIHGVVFGAKFSF